MNLRRAAIKVALGLCGLALLISACARKKGEQEKPLKLSICGEIRPAQQLASPGEARAVFSELTSFFASRDLVLADLAGGFDKGCQPLPRSLPLRWNRSLLEGLSTAGLRVLSLADDHALDCGRESLVAGMNRMLAEGFYVAGAGHSQKEACAPVYLTRGGVTIGLAAFLVQEIPGIEPCAVCSGPARYTRSALIKALQEMKKRASHRVALFHFHENPSAELKEEEMKIIREALDFGADLIIGYGPSEPGGIQRIRGRWVIRSMGRLTDPGAGENKPLRSLIVSAEFTPREMMNLRLMLAETRQGRPRLLRAEEGNAALRSIMETMPPEVRSSTTLIEDILYLK